MEDRIIVDFNALDRMASKLNTAAGDLDAAVSVLSGAYLTQESGAYLRLSGCGTSLRSVGGTVSAGTVAQAVSSYQNALRRVSGRARKLSSSVKQVSARFDQTEASTGRGLSTGEKAPTTDGGGGGGGGSWFDWSAIKVTWKDIIKLVKEGGIIGAGLGLLGNLIYNISTGGTPAKTVLSILKDASKLVGGIAKGFSKNSFNWLGLVKSGEKMSLGEAIGKIAEDYSFGNATNVSGKIAVGAKWAGQILTVATTFYENFFEDTEGNSTGRKFAESVGESAVKVIGGLAIGAVASTLGAPALVAGAIGVVAVWALNSGFKAFTGKEAAESISDFILDNAPGFFQGVADTVKNAAEEVGNAVRKTGEVLSGWWDSLFNPKPSSPLVTGW